MYNNASEARLARSIYSQRVKIIGFEERGGEKGIVRELMVQTE